MMGDRIGERQTFRFRLPWLSVITAARPAEPSRPTAADSAPSQTTSIPIQRPTSSVQRPPFRPPGIAPVQSSPPKSQAPVRTEPPSAPPPPAATESRVTSKPTSPDLAKTEPKSPPGPPAATGSQVTSQPTRAASVPPPLSRRATESQANFQQTSPGRETESKAALQSQSQRSRAFSVPPSPSRTASQPQTTTPQPQSPSRSATQPPKPLSPSRQAAQPLPAPEVISQITSPPKKLEPTTPVAPQPAPSSTKPSLSTSQQQGSQSVESKQLPQVSQPKTQMTSEAIIKKEETPTKTITQPDVVATQPVKAPVPEKAGALTSLMTLKAQAATEKPKESIEEKKVAKEPVKEDKIKISSPEDPVQRTITSLVAAASDSGKQIREFLGGAFLAEQRQKEKQDSPEGKKKLASVTASSDEKQINTVTATNQKDRNIASNSHRNSVINNGEQVPLHKEIREDISKFVNKLVLGQQDQPFGEKPASIITLAGENRGASMHVSSESAKKDGSVHIHRGYKTNPDESPEATTDAEEGFMGRRSQDPTTEEEPLTRAYINSNTQGINNSLLSDSSVHERNPGVHMSLDSTLAEPSKMTKSEVETHKAEFNITPAEKLTYEPTVRRRCLRGLFLETSDSDPDNPEKPRRHGCRYNCREMSKEKEIGVL